MTLPDESVAEALDEVKLRAVYVKVLKLMAAPAPVSMPAQFADALRLLRLLVEAG